MATEEQLIEKLEKNPLVQGVSAPTSRERNGVTVNSYQVLIGEGESARLQNAQIAISGSGEAFWLGSFSLAEYSISKQKVVTHLKELNPPPVFSRERISSYDQGNMYSIIDVYYQGGSGTLDRKSRVVLSDGAGGVVSHELTEAYQDQIV